MIVPLKNRGNDPVSHQTGGERSPGSGEEADPGPGDPVMGPGPRAAVRKPSMARTQGGQLAHASGRPRTPPGAGLQPAATGPARSGARSKQGKDAGRPACARKRPTEDAAMRSSAARCEWAPWDSNPARRIKSPVLYQMS